MNAWQGLDGLSSGARVAVLGAGQSGVAAAKLLAERGFEVVVYDERELTAEVAEKFEGWGVDVAGAGEDPLWEEVGLCVTSPGFPLRHRWLRAAHDAGTDVIGELELGAAYCACPIIAVSGTNGKTTCVELIEQLFLASGIHVEHAGNIGRPLCDAAARSGALDWVIVEVSSFQLETVAHFHPKVAVLLNIQPDHLDRHGGMEAYARLKSSLFDNQTYSDTAFVDAGRLGLVRELTRGTPRWYGVDGAGEPVSWEPGVIHFPSSDGGGTLRIDGSLLDNMITGPAVAASVAVLAACTEVEINGEVSEAIRAFTPAPHRYEAAGDAGGISFIDDSKATNLAAMVAALERTDRPVRLVAGGIFKEKAPEKANEVLARKVECVYLIGQDADLLAESWSHVVPCVQCGTMEVAVREAWAAASCGDVLLLSPACASFDQYSGYSPRGMAFRQIVESIKEEILECVQHG
jgi:UDP-N-acetylmuramoylalanine--D-glutamate ligase